MADRELIAAILTAGMLPTLEVPRSRAQARNRPVTRVEGDAIQNTVDHALGLYRLVLAGLGVDPLDAMAGRDAQPQAPAVAAPNGARPFGPRDPNQLTIVDKGGSQQREPQNQHPGRGFSFPPKRSH
jgi:hypothetical protein